MTATFSCKFISMISRILGNIRNHCAISAPDAYPGLIESVP